MSFDVFLQRFQHGDAAEADAGKLAELLQPYLVETGHGFPALVFDDGRADVYGVDDLASGFMVNHVSGRQGWEFLASVARAADLAILPVGCPVAVPRKDMVQHLPEALRGDAVVIEDGDDLLRLIEPVS